MEKTDPVRRRLRDLIRHAGVGMLMTLDDRGRIVGRPMLPLLIDGDPHVYFLTHQSSAKVIEVTVNSRVAITISGADSRYLVIVGSAAAVRDDRTIARLWKPTYRAWFPDGAGDEEVMVLRVEVERADYWEAPRSRVARVLHAVLAIVRGRSVGTPKKSLSGL